MHALFNSFHLISVASSGLSQLKPKTACDPQNGQVAQLVERSPEKAGVGGSIPSLATNLINKIETLP